jgi:male germ cell-associated kinase
MHRDLKPENLLYADGVLKIADFGLSKESHLKGQHTNYVSTRWYRAPECILRQKAYDGKIDVFAMGCIMAELYTGIPLLPGTTESDMLYRLSMLIGNIPESWKTGYSQAYRSGLEANPGALTNPMHEQVIQKLQ